MRNIEQLLPAEILALASLRGSEYAWPISEIPNVIEAARRCGLVNIGGQLQFRFPEGPTCECYWLQVDTYKELSQDIPNRVERVRQSAEAALKLFKELLATHNFIEEGRKAFPAAFSDFEASGEEIADAACFVWYVEAKNDQ